uniref:Uncharacterized protein n=1 Tax=Steinernema glaseri TaxID=37863 RepID=A0A1I7XWS3_9BILA
MLPLEGISSSQPIPFYRIPTTCDLHHYYTNKSVRVHYALFRKYSSAELGSPDSVCLTATPFLLSLFSLLPGAVYVLWLAMPMVFPIGHDSNSSSRDGQKVVFPLCDKHSGRQPQRAHRSVLTCHSIAVRLIGANVLFQPYVLKEDHSALMRGERAPSLITLSTRTGKPQQVVIAARSLTSLLVRWSVVRTEKTRSNPRDKIRQFLVVLFGLSLSENFQFSQSGER